MGPLLFVFFFGVQSLNENELCMLRHYNDVRYYPSYALYNLNLFIERTSATAAQAWTLVVSGHPGQPHPLR